MKCAFCLTRDGKAVKIQRTIFSECFYIMALDELSRVTGDKEMQQEAEKMMAQLIFWVQVDSTGLGRPMLPGATPTNSMAVPMMLMCLVQQLTEGRSEEAVLKYKKLSSWCVQQILQHVQRDGTAILENVSLEGTELPGCQGRLQNPGHALEAGWFLLEYASQWEDKELQDLAINKFVELPFQIGWDKEHGGLFYFLDVDGHPPTQLEWNMKLWWPHCEALIAFLMAYSQTKRTGLLERFSQVYDYTFSHFSDDKHGEWFGYLSQDGKVALDFKGGPYKGFFHLPRCLYMCERILDDLINNVPHKEIGVFYEALPAIGADGTNIMRLIPVQIVNGKRVQSVISATIPSRVQKTFRPIAPRPSGNQVNVLPCQLDVACPSLNKYPPKTAEAQELLKTPQSRVRTVPSPQVPSGAKSQNLLSLPDSPSSSNSVCQSNGSLDRSKLETLGSPTSHLKLIPKVSQRANSPMKWVIEEVNSTEATGDIPHYVLSKSSATNEAHHPQALVMCNDKVFFATQKNSPLMPLQSKDTSCQLKNSTSHLQNKTISRHRQPNEVIDLCSDNYPDEQCKIISRGMPTVSSVDEDNVIFVSYIPPKPECVPTQHLAEKIPENVSYQTRTVVHVTEQTATQNVSKTVHDPLPCENKDGSSVDKRQTLDQSVTSSFSICKSSDHRLRQMFGITSDVRICLQRVNSRSSLYGLKDPAQEFSTGGIQQNKKQNPAHCSSPIKATRVKLSDEQNLSETFLTSSPHADTEITFNYVEPIEDDISYTIENNSPYSPAQTQNVVRPNTSRMGRTRKRTKCRCCIPGKTMKSSARLEDSDKSTWINKHTSKRGARKQKGK
ncbi:uncharacterized protein LOC144072006 isoform X1 [Stigmatopora argus]